MCSAEELPVLLGLPVAWPADQRRSVPVIQALLTLRTLSDYWNLGSEHIYEGGRKSSGNGNMNRSELLDWRDRYNEENRNDLVVERRVGRRIRSNGYMTTADLVEVMKWKFDTQKLGNQVKWARSNGLAEIRERTRIAFGGGRGATDEGRLTSLMQLKGVKAAVGSVILSFWNPRDFAVFDFHAWDGLKAERRVSWACPQERCWEPDKYLREFLPAIRKIARRYGLATRDVEKAYFQRDYKAARA